MVTVIKVHPRGIGRNGGWASLMTGAHVDSGPDLSLMVNDRSEAYAIVDWITPPSEDRRVDRAKVDYRDFESNWLQVKLLVEEEHKDVLERLYTALLMRDGYLDKQMIDWAISPDEHREPWGH